MWPSCCSNTKRFSTPSHQQGTKAQGVPEDEGEEAGEVQDEEAVAVDVRRRLFKAIGRQFLSQIKALMMSA